MSERMTTLFGEGKWNDPDYLETVPADNRSEASGLAIVCSLDQVFAFIVLFPLGNLISRIVDCHRFEDLFTMWAFDSITEEQSFCFGLHFLSFAVLALWCSIFSIIPPAKELGK